MTPWLPSDSGKMPPGKGPPGLFFPSLRSIQGYVSILTLRNL